MDKPSDFVIHESSREYVIENVKARDFNNYHTHIRKRKKKRVEDKAETCHMLINLICKKKIPKSEYLRESAKRISRDNKYIAMIEHKEMKDSQKPRFIRVNKGVPRVF